jgi:hypothetical protein
VHRFGKLSASLRQAQCIASASSVHRFGKLSASHLPKVNSAFWLCTCLDSELFSPDTEIMDKLKNVSDSIGEGNPFFFDW